MSVKKDRYLVSIISGYGVIVLQILISLVSIPLALKYLGKEGFAIWALAIQVATWLQLLEGGMNGALARFLIDYQDDAQGANLQDCIATGFRVFALQGFTVLLVSLLLASFAGPAFGLNAHDSHIFGRVLAALGAATCLSFMGKVVASWLYASQRIDICNINTLGLILGEFLVFWLLLKSGHGIYSLVWARLFNTVGTSIFGWWAGIKITNFPARMLLGSWNTKMFRRLATYSGGMFLLTLGTQLLTMTQTILVSKHLGLAAAAVWATAPKLYQVILQAVSKFWDYRAPHLSSLMSRNQTTTLTHDFSAVFRTTAYLGGGGLGATAALNPLFLSLWTHDLIQWNHHNDSLIALAFYLSLLIRCITDFVMQTKKIGWMPVLMFLEGLFFVAAATILLPGFGISGMLFAAVVAGSFLRLPYAWCLFRDYLKLDSRYVRMILFYTLRGGGIGLSLYLLLSLVDRIFQTQATWPNFLTQGLLAALVLGPLGLKLTLAAQKREPA